MRNNNKKKLLLRSLHTESEVFIRNFRKLKNKYDLTLCQSRLHTASETFVRHKKFRSGSIFCVFVSVACILIGKNEEYGKTHANISDSVCNGLYSYSLADPYRKRPTSVLKP